MRSSNSSHGRWLLPALLLLSCKDDGEGTESDPGTGTTSTTTADDTSTGGTTMVADADSSAGDQGASSGLAESSSGEPPPTEVRLAGVIQDYFAMGPIADAEISVLGQPGLSTVSDAKGQWELLGLPVETFDRILVAESANYWGAVVPAQTGLMDDDEFELSQVSLQVIDLQINALQAQDPTVTLEDGTAALLVALLQNTATGAVVELDPPPPPDSFYALDPGGMPVLGSNEIQFGLYPVAVFFNLPPGPEGTYEITVTHPERECTLEDPQPPTFERHINLLRVDCPPPA